MRIIQVLSFVGAVVCVLAITTVGAVATKTVWRPWMLAWLQDEPPKEEAGHGAAATSVKLSPQAQANLGVRVAEVQLQPDWRWLSIPGEVVEMPGQSDRAVTSPVSGVVTSVHRRPWEAVKAGQELFTIRPTSEFLHASQAGLHNAQKELDFTNAEIDRVRPREGQPPVVSDARWIELNNQQTRQKSGVAGHRHMLSVLGLTEAQITDAQAGKFLKELVVRVPETAKGGDLEVQELKVTVGEQVAAGQLLGYLTDHQHLYLEGHAFKNEVGYLENALAGTGADEKPIEVEWLDDSQRGWGQTTDPLHVRFLANVIDPASQTFPFYIPLRNQSQDYTRGDSTHRVWRYRPGQKVRLNVPVEKFERVIVAPLQAVVREGGETYVFRQNGSLFERVAVQVRYEDHRHVAIEYDGNLAPGQSFAVSGAAGINRALKLSQGGGEEGGDEHGHHHHHHH